MGTRYRAILDYLNEEVWGVDIETPPEDILRMASDADRTIICTPTENHYNVLKRIIPLGKPVLCEKPITKSTKDVEKILVACQSYKTPFTMTFQYSELVPPSQNAGLSHYHYFRSGRDGLVWDCLQIIGLAKGEIEISNESPTWKCMINDLNLKFGDMDAAYINFVRKWTAGLINQSHDELIRIHEKTERMSNEPNFK